MGNGDWGLGVVLAQGPVILHIPIFGPNSQYPFFFSSKSLTFFVNYFWMVPFSIHFGKNF